MNLQKIKELDLESLVIPALNKNGLDGDTLLKAWNTLIEQAEKAEQYKKKLNWIVDQIEGDYTEEEIASGSTAGFSVLLSVIYEEAKEAAR